MSYSLLSTKRKFHRLLDSFSNGASASNASEPTDTTAGADGTSGTSGLSDRPTKRLRSAAKQRSQLVAASPQLSVLLNRHAAASRTASTNSRATMQPNIMSGYGGSAQRAEKGEVSRVPATRTWNPKDKAAFMERVETFQSPGDWTFKRDEICAVAFAKWGWRLVDVETVECVSCHKRFVVYVRHYPATRQEAVAGTADGEDETEEQDRGDDKHADAFVERTIAKMESEHDSHCLWRKMHCDDSIWSLTMWPANKSLEALHQRYEAILKYSEVLPPVISMPEELQNGEHSVTALTDMLDSLYPSRPVSQSNENGQAQAEVVATYPPDVRQKALAIALLGWSLVPQPANKDLKDALFHCDQCLARVGIWLFWPQAPGKEPVYDEFDIAHHNMGCPWSNADSQNAGMKLDAVVTLSSAWEILAGMVISQSASAQRQREEGGRSSMEESRPVTPSRTPRLTDEERKKKHKLGMAWLSKLKLGHKNDK